MPISPREIEDHVKDEYKLNELFITIDTSLKRNGVVASSTVHTRNLPEFICKKIAQAYTNVGWKVTYNSYSDQRDSFTSFVFMKSG